MSYKNRVQEITSGGQLLGVPPSLVKYVTDNPKFALWSGSSKVGQHHYGTGGLQFHIWEVMLYCMTNAKLVHGLGHKVNMKILFLAALYHDVGKMWDYTPHISPEAETILQLDKVDSWTVWRGSSHKREIHHISRSAIEWTRAVALTGEGKDIEDQVLHCILSHHGQREWGSPVAPKSREAWLLFLCDGISARTNDCDTLDMVGRAKNI